MRAARALSLGALALALWTADSTGQPSGTTARQEADDDVYLAGGQVDVRTDIHGDLVVAGGRVAIAARVTGDVLAAGGFVTVEGTALDDVRVAGGQVTIRSEVTGDVTAVGGSVSLPREARVGGNAYLAGGEVEVEGRIARSLRAAGSRVRLGSEVDGDVEIAAGTLEILGSAHVRGALVYRSASEAAIAPGARIDGGVRRETTLWADPGRAWRIARSVVLALGLGGLVLTGIVMALVVPGFTAKSARAIRAGPWASLGIGFAALVCGPIAAVVLMATVVGAMTGLALLALYAVALLVAVVVGATWIGAPVARLARAAATPTRVAVAVLVGVAVLWLAQFVPFAGRAAAFAVLILGLGGSLLHAHTIYSGWRDQDG